ncbi:hypothetical protein VST7929_01811 [Vibrio stylophorae]|uniref:TadE-like domain-containing protein n=1 Tax=Vibrio stylophorae TaxID=659351 RepID=A0ABN8DS48_9VIBR|nr:TadE/TadG family type IV pilus assembly protein [Vibrio stylophorae]CAH0533934.1 hypothetical protein VST7929_01811 [Vibrio stylophorae]
MKHAHHQRGLAAVELAITLPILLLLLVAVSEIGRLLIHYNTLTKAVQDGARYAVVDIYGTAAANQIADVNEIKNMVVYGNKGGSGDALLVNLNTGNVTVSQANSYVIVTAQLTYAPAFIKLPEFFGSGGDSLVLPIRASALMRTGP